MALTCYNGHEMLLVDTRERTKNGRTVIERYYQCNGPDCHQKIRRTSCGQSRRTKEITEWPLGLDPRLYW